MARLLTFIGIDFGSASALIAANAENPYGFFEHEKLVRANQHLLVGEHPPWLQAIDYGSVGFDCAAVSAATRARFEAEARELLDQLDGSVPRGLKDPRLCLTLPCWRPLLGRPVCLHIVRHPVDVARSLERRGNIPLPVGVAMWEHYNLRVLEYTRDLPVFRLRFESLAAQGEASLSSLLVFLHTQGILGRPYAESEYANYLGAFDTDLIHNQGGHERQDELLNPAQSALLEALLEEPAEGTIPARRLSIGAEHVLRMHESAHPLPDHASAVAVRAVRRKRQAQKHRMLFARLHNEIDRLRETQRTTRKNHQEELQRIAGTLAQRLHAERTRMDRILTDSEAEVSQLEYRVDQLLSDANAIFSSFSWRSGRTLKNVLLAVKGQREGHTAENHIQKIAEEHQNWKCGRPARAADSPSAGIAAYAAPWMRIHGQTRAIVAVITGQGRTSLEGPLDSFLDRLSHTLAASNGPAVLPLTMADVPNAPANVLIVADSAICEEADVDKIAAYAAAREIPVVCLADSIANALSRPFDRRSGDAETTDPGLLLVRLAHATIALTTMSARKLEHVHGRVVLFGDDEASDESEPKYPLPPGSTELAALLTELAGRSFADHRVASFEWPRLPIVQDQDFDEEAYLSQQPDVTKAIEDGIFCTAREHWDRHGQDEVRRGDRQYVPGMVLDACRGAWHLSSGFRIRLRREISTWPRTPKISIVMPAWNSKPEWLDAAVSSLLEQTYPNWELCIADDGSTDRDTISYLNGLSDPRIFIRRLDRNQGIASASNVALEMATGDYVALLDHDDTLAQDALYLVALRILRSDPDLIYSDEDKLTLDCSIVEPCHKPQFSPDLLLSQNYISHLGVYRRSRLTQIGGFRQGYDGAQDYDLVLRFTANAARVEHLPYCLYHWRKVAGSTADRFDAKDYAWEAGRRALVDHLRQSDIAGTVDLGKYPGTYAVRRRISATPRVAIVIPFRDQPTLLDTCISSVLAKTEYQNYEILGVSNESSDPQTYLVMDALSRRDSRVRFIRHDIPFNYSEINNHAVKHVDADHLLFLNNDIEVLSPEWLTALLEHSQRPDVGCVGARLLYPDRSIQHAGVGIGMLTLAGHLHRHLSDQSPGYFARPWQIQNISAITGACMMVSRDVFEEVRGFDAEHLPVAFNDIDLCLRVRERGYLNIYTPVCTLIHHESKTRGNDDTPEKRVRFASEVRYMQERHARILANGDPYLNPNLSLHAEEFRVTTEL